MECKIEPCDISPFFLRTKSGDHNIVALTNDGRIFICGYTFGRFSKSCTSSDLNIMTQYRVTENDYFIDMSTQYYSTFLLTSKLSIHSHEPTLYLQQEILQSIIWKIKQKSFIHQHQGLYSQ